ncbi:MAG TPA: DUF1508 domain-containing protein [Gemmatimonadales bacterium]|nr:DUF1508 domain-containing protein [Gemmatimonadales bacterium]
MPSISRRAALARASSAFGLMGLLGPRVLSAQTPRLQFEVYRGARRDFRWRLKSANGRVVATSGEGYKTKAACLAGIALVREGSRAAELEDLT